MNTPVHPLAAAYARLDAARHTLNVAFAVYALETRLTGVAPPAGTPAGDAYADAAKALETARADCQSARSSV